MQHASPLPGRTPSRRAERLAPVVQGYAGALILIGAATIAVGGAAHWTAYIPLALGLVVASAAIGAWRSMSSARTAVTIACAVGALALAGTLSALPAALSGAIEPERLTAVLTRATTAVVTIGAGIIAVVLAAAGRGRNPDANTNA
jgi:hypothetical protein